MPKLKINLDDPETKAIWETAKRAKEEVASWPAWKRGEWAPSDEVVEDLNMNIVEFEEEISDEEFWKEFDKVYMDDSIPDVQVWSTVRENILKRSQRKAK